MRHEEQALRPTIRKILEGIVEFRQPALERLADSDWTNAHKEELQVLLSDLANLEIKLSVLLSETW